MIFGRLGSPLRTLLGPGPVAQAVLSCSYSRGVPKAWTTAGHEEGHEQCQHHENTPTHVARDLGDHREALRSWVRQAEADAGERDDRLTTAERDELKELRKQNAELRRANEILKAASVFSPRRSTVPGRGRAGNRPPA
ncbi:transposase [Streptomyces sp. NPDC056069]|uniref:transposase n=1 Tax=Streptomyces sp. NPDC056069 TaxID=3345702 RepID=UPI0035E228EE